MPTSPDPDGPGTYLRQELDRRLAADPDNWCLLCGGTLIPHDDIACDEKMRNWKPMGIVQGARLSIAPTTGPRK